MTNLMGGTRIVTNDQMLERVQYSRSPARAKRRAKLGHPQHWITRPMRGGIWLDRATLCVHPALYAEMKADPRIMVTP